MVPNQNPDPELVRKGRRAAGRLFAVAAGAQVALLLYTRLRETDQLARGLDFLFGGIVTLVVGLLAAIIISIRLPAGARKPFWVTGLLYVVLTAVIWGASCGLAVQ